MIPFDLVPYSYKFSNMVFKSFLRHTPTCLLTYYITNSTTIDMILIVRYDIELVTGQSFYLPKSLFKCFQADFFFRMTIKIFFRLPGSHPYLWHFIATFFRKFPQ